MVFFSFALTICFIVALYSSRLFSSMIVLLFLFALILAVDADPVVELDVPALTSLETVVCNEVEQDLSRFTADWVYLEATLSASTEQDGYQAVTPLQVYFSSWTLTGFPFSAALVQSSVACQQPCFMALQRACCSNDTNAQLFRVVDVMSIDDENADDVRNDLNLLASGLLCKKGLQSAFKVSLAVLLATLMLGMNLVFTIHAACLLIFIFLYFIF